MDTKNLLEIAADEIAALRRNNEILRAQVAVVEAFTLALRAPAPLGGGMAPDVLWTLRREIANWPAPKSDDQARGQSDAGV